MLERTIAMKGALLSQTTITGTQNAETHKSKNSIKNIAMERKSD